MKHQTVFKLNKDNELIQVIINSKDLMDMESLGFVDHVDKIKKTKKKASSKKVEQGDK